MNSWFVIAIKSVWKHRIVLCLHVFCSFNLLCSSDNSKTYNIFSQVLFSVSSLRLKAYPTSITSIQITIQKTRRRHRKRRIDPRTWCKLSTFFFRLRKANLNINIFSTFSVSRKGKKRDFRNPNRTRPQTYSDKGQDGDRDMQPLWSNIPKYKNASTSSTTA